MNEWNARRILKELCDGPRRRQVLAAFWKGAEPEARQVVVSALARNLNFRLDSVRKATPERKAELLGMQMHAPEFREPLEMALVLYHTSDGRELLAAFLDFWKIPHVDGSIEVEEYTIPGRAEVEKAVTKLASRFDRRDILLYLATAGLMMGQGEPAWREATWPVVDQMLAAA